MLKRRKMSKKASRRVFRKGALSIRTRNLKATPMRGGFRI